MLLEGRPVTFRVDNGKLTLTMKEAGELYGYAHPREAIAKLYSEHKDEFDNDCTHIYVSDMGVDVHTPPVRERLFTVDGLILIGMFCELPKGKKVRKWLRVVGREVAVTGSYEFDSDSTRIHQIGVPGKEGYARVREFSLEGLALLCMFSEQPTTI